MPDLLCWECCTQEELNMSKEAFRDRYGENPRKDDLTILLPRQDDPTEQAGPGAGRGGGGACEPRRHGVGASSL